jgi:hypothetical protein
LGAALAPADLRASVPAVRRRIGLLLMVLGIVAMVVGTASGCGSLFSFNGRHPVAVVPLTPGTPLRSTFNAQQGKRYTLAVHVVFDREGLPEANGQLLVEAKFPLVATIEDTSGVAVARAIGWVDPSEPPTVLYGHGAAARQRRPMGMPPAELVAERLLGPVTVAVARPVTYSVDLGADRIGRARVLEARVALYDDAIPRSITFAFLGAFAGLVAFLIGATTLLVGVFRARRGGARSRPIV